ncbi:uncharacterized protein K460DRAFT_401650 [Cucurbitaria berberidis CBS 394.84]|uniref:Zn(2)-C6 fungal-type domain-containing protein n=1 Tax=Cucurbitaria berberidis CBS 394.84 TaxID=1168544 RepID=A0A9P4GUK4_9PLEO|nr:uncharacterized protein K460DRAFT_401650 [Cucurbitaria berberidis CBS 394.84]KAF1851635.1 hypothetical protein K460DRAFT_401650 [Cucurbitaria berberidis CBS 394.84]
MAPPHSLRSRRLARAGQAVTQRTGDAQPHHTASLIDSMDLRVDIVRRGGCATCEARGLGCDEALPACNACRLAQLPCPGYAVHIQWPTELLDVTPTARPLPRPAAFSSFGLPSKEDGLVLHFMKNVARFALAIDYHGNGYRKFATLALHDPMILDAVLAVARSHLSRWHGTVDVESRFYLKKAIGQLQQRFRSPHLLKSETTVVAMLLLATYEVFNGSSKWKHHYHAIAGWTQAFSAAVDLDPFLKTWITLLDTQSGLNCGTALIPQVAAWTAPSPARPSTTSAIDPFLGCSVHLPHLMLQGAQLYQRVSADAVSSEELEQRIDSLQAQIRACEIVPSDRDPPFFAITCYNGVEAVTAMDEFTQHNYMNKAIATAEIFRHATHVYVHRIRGDAMQARDEIQQSVNAVFSWLAQVPDAVGPGANVGWALVVIGTELDDEERREYIRCRWKALQVLGIGNTEAAARLLEEVWSKRDVARLFNEPMPRWQDVMRSSGADQILI